MRIELRNADDDVVAYLDAPASWKGELVQFKGTWYVRKGQGPEYREAAGPAWHLPAPKVGFRGPNGSLMVEVGDFVGWRTLGGADYEGVVREIDGNALVVFCTDGVTRTVEA